MPTDRVKLNERRFRRGTILLFFIAAMSAVSTSALYHGVDSPIFYSTSLALPVVADIALQTFFAGWIWMEKVRYYWFIAALVLAAVLGAIALLSGTISLSGRAFSNSFTGRGLSRIFSAFGMAQLLSARALSALGLLFYLLDGGVSVALVLASPQTFTPYYLFLMGNLLIHLSVLSYLGYAFSASVGGGRSEVSAEYPHHGDAEPE